MQHSLAGTAVLGQIFAVIVSVCWAQNSIMYTLAGNRVGSGAVTHIRLWVALPAIAITHLAFTANILPVGYAGTAYLFLGVSGFLGFCLADLFIFQAFLDIGPRETLVVLTLSPIFAGFISWFSLGESLSPLQMTGIACTIAGIIWVVLVERRGYSGEKGNAEVRKKRIGVLYAVLGSLSQAAGMALSKQGLNTGIHPVSANFIRISAGLLGLVIIASIRGNFFKDFKKMRDTRALLFISIGALVGPVLGIILTMYALALAPVGIVTTLMQISPILLLPIDRFILKKTVPWGAAGGTVVAVAGAVLLFLV